MGWIWEVNAELDIVGFVEGEVFGKGGNGGIFDIADGRNEGFEVAGDRAVGV